MNGNGNSHISKYWFVYIIGGILGFSWIIFSMNAQYVNAQFTAMDKRVAKIEEKFEEISDQLYDMQTDIALIKQKLGIKDVEIRAEK
jgi:hypothetical protein